MRIQYRGGVFELVADSVGIATKRVQRRHAHCGSERFAASPQPVGVGLPRPSRHQIQKSCLRPTVTPGQVHDSGEFLGSFSWSRLVVPDVLVDTESVDVGEPIRVISQVAEQRGDRVPDGVPVDPEPPRHRRHRGGVPLDTTDRPPHRPCGQLGPRTGQWMIFAEPADRAGRFQAAVAPLPPHQLHRRAERRDVVQPSQPSPMPGGDHPAS
jgi:hypothetical protein